MNKNQLNSELKRKSDKRGERIMDINTIELIVLIIALAIYKIFNF